MTAPGHGRYGKHADFIVLTDDDAHGFNGAMPLHLLTRAVRTPVNEFFVRSHGPTPHLDPAAYTLTVTLAEAGAPPAVYTLNDLLALPTEHVTAALACAGNRRAELHAHQPIADELLWDAHAVGSATWTGVRLRDLLDDAALRHDAAEPADAEPGDADDAFTPDALPADDDGPARHVVFTGADVCATPDGPEAFSASVSLAEADDVLIAWAMNGEPLTAAHGFPVRAVVPGFIGARSVKWLTHIHLHDAPSAGYYQQHAYRLARPGMESADPRGHMLGALMPSAATTTVRPVREGVVLVRGYAHGGPLPIVRVELSIDDGPWQIALPVGSIYPNDRLAWRIWERTLSLAPGPHMLAVRAFDDEMWPQPEHIADVWNSRGYANNAVHRVAFTVGDFTARDGPAR